LRKSTAHIHRPASAAWHVLLATACVIAAFAACVGVTGAAAAPATATVANGDFETGDFGDWALFTTANGAVIPTIASFDTDGDGTSSLAARLIVGQAVFEGFDVQQGVVLAQAIELEQGELTVSATVASELDFPFCNGDGGTVQLVVDSVVIDVQAFGEICGPSVTRAVLDGALSIADAGTHEVRLIATRAGTLSGVALYVDDVVVRGTATELATIERLAEVLDGYSLGRSGAGLRATLEVAERLERKGRVPAACVALSVFLRQVATREGEALTPGQAAELTGLAERVRVSLSC
jgi:hypothetical protein